MSDYDVRQSMAEQAAKALEEQTRLDWLGALACPGARRIFGRMICTAAFGRSHCPGDPQATAFNEGIRAVGLEIMQFVEQAKRGESAALLAEHITGDKSWQTKI